MGNRRVERPTKASRKSKYAVRALAELERGSASCPVVPPYSEHRASVHEEGEVREGCVETYEEAVTPVVALILVGLTPLLYGRQSLRPIRAGDDQASVARGRYARNAKLNCGW